MRISVVDLLFNWPPDAGARIDTWHLMRYLRRHGDVDLITVDLNDGFPRGRTDRDLGLPVHRILIEASVQSHAECCGRIRATVAACRPDLVILADAWHLKARLLRNLADFSLVVRFYTHEGLCLKGHGHQYRNDAVCPVDILADPSARQRDCLPCRRQWMSQTQTRVFDREMELADVERDDYLDDLRYGLRAARAVIVSNHDMVHRLWPYTARVIRQPMGFDPDQFRPAPLPATKRFLLFGRAYDYLKGAHVLLEAGRRLWATRQDFSIAFTGRPSRVVSDRDVDQPYIEILAPVPHDQVHHLIAQAYVCVLPALWPEPFPAAGVEAFACGRTVIATDVGGQKELVSDDVNGILISPNDPAVLAAAMGKLLESPETVERLRQGAIESAAAYHWSALHSAAYGPLLGDTVHDRLAD